MRKILPFLLCLCLLFSALPARANQWGATGQLLVFLESTKDFDDYPNIVAAKPLPGNPYVPAVVWNLQHSQLLLLEQDDQGRLKQLGRYPAAVPEPDSWQKVAVEALPEGGFALSFEYKDGRMDERFTFGLRHYDPFTNTHSLTLLSASLRGRTLTLDESDSHYQVAGNDTIWQSDAIPLERFTYSQLPTSEGEISHRNHVKEALGPDSLSYRSILLNPGQDALLPVYTAPEEKAFRGADGKAAVSLKAPFQVLAVTQDGLWWLIRYEISASAGRLGFVKVPAGMNQPAPILPTETRALKLMLDTVLTDDPYGEGRTLKKLRTMEELAVLGWLDSSWALVQTSISGKDAWGFVPIAALMPPEDIPDLVVAKTLQGDWRFLSGGEVFGSGFTLGPNGRMPDTSVARYTIYPESESTGVMALTLLNDGALRYHYVLNHVTDRMDTLSLTRGETGGSYRQMAFSPSPLLPEGMLLDLSGSEVFSTQELETGVKAILAQLATWTHINPTHLYYLLDEQSQGLDVGDPLMVIFMDFIVLDDPKAEEYGLEPGQQVYGWKWVLQKDASGAWQVSDSGLI